MIIDPKSTQNGPKMDPGGTSETKINLIDKQSSGALENFTSPKNTEKSDGFFKKRGEDPGCFSLEVKLSLHATLPPYNLTTLHPYNPTTLQPYIPTTQQPYIPTTLNTRKTTVTKYFFRSYHPMQPYISTTLQPYILTTLQLYNPTSLQLCNLTSLRC